MSQGIVATPENIAFRVKNIAAVHATPMPGASVAQAIQSIEGRTPQLVQRFTEVLPNIPQVTLPTLQTQARTPAAPLGPGGVNLGATPGAPVNLGGGEDWWKTSLAQIGIPTALAAVLGVGLARAKFPWETGTGQGMISPLSAQVQDPATGMWYQEGQLPGQALALTQGAAMVPGTAAGALGDVMVRKTWTNASRDGRIPATVESIMLTNGKVITRSLITGEIKTHRPKKHIVISSNPRMSSIGKLERTYNRVIRKLAKKSKALKLAK